MLKTVIRDQLSIIESRKMGPDPGGIELFEGHAEVYTKRKWFCA